MGQEITKLEAIFFIGIILMMPTAIILYGVFIGFPTKDERLGAPTYIGIVKTIDTYGGDGMFSSGIKTRITLEGGESFTVSNYDKFSGIQEGGHYKIWTSSYPLPADGDYIEKYEAV